MLFEIYSQRMVSLILEGANSFLARRILLSLLVISIPFFMYLVGVFRSVNFLPLHSTFILSLGVKLVSRHIY